MQILEWRTCGVNRHLGVPMVLSRFVWSITLYFTLHAVKPRDGAIGHHSQPQLSRNCITSFNVYLESINTWTDFYPYSASTSGDTGVWLACSCIIDDCGLHIGCSDITQSPITHHISLPGIELCSLFVCSTILHNECKHVLIN